MLEDANQDNSDDSTERKGVQSQKPFEPLLDTDEAAKLLRMHPRTLRTKARTLHRKIQVGDVKKYPTESAVHAAADALRLTINNRCEHRNLRRTTINTLWEHYSQEELPLKALSTQDAYVIYANNWIVPRWGNLPLEQVKTVEVERWLRATGVSNATQAKIKCVMSALFSHAVRWEFCGHNPISSGISWV